MVSISTADVPDRMGGGGKRLLTEVTKDGTDKGRLNDAKFTLPERQDL